MHSDKFKEVMSATRRNNLLNAVKTQNSTMLHNFGGDESISNLAGGYENANDYYIDTL